MSKTGTALEEVVSGYIRSLMIEAPGGAFNLDASVPLSHVLDGIFKAAGETAPEWLATWLSAPLGPRLPVAAEPFSLIDCVDDDDPAWVPTLLEALTDSKSAARVA